MIYRRLRYSSLLFFIAFTLLNNVFYDQTSTDKLTIKIRVAIIEATILLVSGAVITSTNPDSKNTFE